MTENLSTWDKLGKTDPSHTKPFTRAGGFKGTAVKPMYSYRLMTEHFGPCGKGWGIHQPSFEVQHMTDETVVYCTVAIWYENQDQVAWGVGGDKVRSRRGNGNEFVDDEAYKKAFTDAVTNALKFIGVAADVHMGMFDDNKYVNTLIDEFNDNSKATRSSAELKRSDAWQEFENELADCKSIVALDRFREVWREKVKNDGWNKAFKDAAKDAIEGHEKTLTLEAG